MATGYEGELPFDNGRVAQRLNSVQGGEGRREESGVQILALQQDNVASK